MSHQRQPPTCWSKCPTQLDPSDALSRSIKNHAKTRKLFVVRDLLAQTTSIGGRACLKLAVTGGVENVMETRQGWRASVLYSFIWNESVNGCRWVTSNPTDQLVARPSSSAMTVVNGLHHSQSLANTFRGMRRDWWADVSFSRISVS